VIVSHSVKIKPQSGFPHSYSIC